MTWTRSDFCTRASYGPIQRRGWMCGSFSVSRDRGDWLIFHMPTGMMFAYSYWKSARDAKLFAEALMEKGDWSDYKLDSHAKVFNETCHAIAKSLGIKRRETVSIL